MASDGLYDRLPDDLADDLSDGLPDSLSDDIPDGVSDQVRRQASLLWKMQQLNDRLQRHLQTEAALLDPTGVGFAFGGVSPGFMHAKGQLHEVHRVSYSVDRVGKYLLHVRLRKLARPVKGSPFALVVAPGAAHESTTYTRPETRSLIGEVGVGFSEAAARDDPLIASQLALDPKAEKDNALKAGKVGAARAAGGEGNHASGRPNKISSRLTYGVSMLLKTNDRVGNICDQGGGVVTTTTSFGEAMKCTCEDNGDGTYLLAWQSKRVGVAEVKILINRNNIRGSPFQITLVSTTVELPKTIVTFEQLASLSKLDRLHDAHAVAGQPAPVTLKLIDGFGNPSTPGDKWKVGVAITNSKKKVYDLEMHAHFSGEWGAVPGTYVITYVAKTAGNADLHLWREPLDGNPQGREALPQSPFSLYVTSAVPNSLMSYVDPQWTIAVVGQGARTKTSKGGATDKQERDREAASAAASKTITAGDTVSVRAYGVDEFGNAAYVDTVQIKALLIAPNCERHIKEVSLVKDSKAQKDSKGARALEGQSSVYEIRHETVHSGTYLIHVSLHGVDIKNSPISFVAEPAAPHPPLTEVAVPETADAHPAGDDVSPATVMLRTRDKHGNECKGGGLRIQGKLVLIKNGDEGANTILMPSNHSINIEDRGDGKYLMHVTVNFSSTVKLIVNMDKDLPGTSGELPPIQLVFVDERSRDRRQPRERPGAGVLAGAPRSATPELEPSLEPAHHKSRPSTPDPG